MTIKSDSNNITDCIRDFERKYALKVLYAATVDDYFGVFSNDSDKANLRLMSLQNRKVIKEDYGHITITSYSLQIWFCLSGFNSDPYVTAERALWLLDSEPVVSDERVIDALKKILLNKKKYIQTTFQKPTYLLKKDDLNICKKYILRILLSYFMSDNAAGFPNKLKDIINLPVIPSDVLNSHNYINFLDSMKYQYIVDTIIKYHGKSNPMFVFDYIQFSRDEYEMIFNMANK